MKKWIICCVVLLSVASMASAAPQMLSWYQFEQNAADSAGVYDGTVSGTVNYTYGPARFNQMYAAGSDGSSYITLPADGFPKTGVGNGLESFTYALWVNFTHTDGKDRIMGNFNEGFSSAVRLSAVGGANGGEVACWLRTEENNSSEVNTGDASVPLGEWCHAVATYDGTTFRIYLNGELKGENTVTGTFAAWQQPTTILAENSRGTIQGHCDTTQIDDLQIYDAPMTEAEVAALYQRALQAKPHNPIPEDGAVAVETNAALTWTGGLDLDNMTNVNSDILQYYVWLGDASDPNLALSNVATVPVTNWTDPTADGVYVPSAGTIVEDGVYGWQIEAAVDNGSGLACPAGDPKNIMSPVWTFEAIKSRPVVLQHPVSTKVDEGQDVVFTVEYASINPATAVWTQDGVAITAPNVSVVTDDTTSVLTITNATQANEGDYVCALTSAGGETSSHAATLSLKRLLAWYEFEQNANDSVGTNDGVAVNNLAYSTGYAGSYGADPNGSNYIELTTDAYPKAGIGNGLEQFTYSAWVKKGVFSGDGRILGNFNQDSTTAVQFGISGDGGVGVYIRQADSTGTSCNTPGGLLTDDQWHNVVATFDGTTVKVYVDGLLRDQDTDTPLSEFGEWQNPMVLCARNSRGDIQQNYPGELDDLQIYNFPMSDEDVAQLYYDYTGESICLYGYSDFDFTGPNGEPDCVVDIHDFAAFASQWMYDGLYPAN